MKRRVLVALESRRLGERLLETAARLAAARRAEVVGFYVEEADFLYAAGLPTARVLGSHGGVWEALEPGVMERAFRARANEIRDLLDQTCGRLQLPWRFETGRGSPAELLLTAAVEAELVVLGRSRRTGRMVGSTARRAIAGLRASVLLAGAGMEAPGRIVVVYAGDRRVLDTAAEIAELFRAPVQVVLVADNTDSLTALREQVDGWADEAGLPATVRAAPAGGAGALVEALAGTGGLVVIDAGSGLALDALIDRLDAPVLIVR